MLALAARIEHVLRGWRSSCAVAHARSLAARQVADVDDDLTRELAFYNQAMPPSIHA